MRRQSGVSLVEIAMMFVVVSIVAVVALPVIVSPNKSTATQAINDADSIKKVKSAYALAIAEQGDYPLLDDVVEYIDADFAYQTSDYSGIIFRDGKQRLTVKTFQDTECTLLTGKANPGVSDVVRCIL